MLSCVTKRQWCESVHLNQVLSFTIHVLQIFQHQRINDSQSGEVSNDITPVTVELLLVPVFHYPPPPHCLRKYGSLHGISLVLLILSCCDYTQDEEGFMQQSSCFHYSVDALSIFTTWGPHATTVDVFVSWPSNCNSSSNCESCRP